jgi:hypothetical protein
VVILQPAALCTPVTVLTNKGAPAPVAGIDLALDSVGYVAACRPRRIISRPLARTGPSGLFLLATGRLVLAAGLPHRPRPVGSTVLPLVLRGDQPVEGVLDHPMHIAASDTMPKQIPRMLELVLELLTRGELKLVPLATEGLERSEARRWPARR